MSRTPLRHRVLATAAAAVSCLFLAGVGSADAAGPVGSRHAVPPLDGGSSGAAATSSAQPTVTRTIARNPLLKEILSEGEGSVVDPALNALCRAFIGRPNPYGDPAPNVDQIVNDGTAVTGSQTGCSTAQNETSIAVNPHNADNIVAGANDYRLFNPREDRNDASGLAYTSFDGGATWKNIVLPHLTLQTGATGQLSIMDSAGDPVVQFGANNTVYYGNIVFSRGAPAAGGTEAASAIVVSVSHDGGLTWDDPTIVQINGVDSAGNAAPTRAFNDKVWLAGDPSSGQVYVTWTRFVDSALGAYVESPIVAATSSDFGATFSPRVRVDTQMADFTGGITPFSQGSNPKIGRDGTLYIAYEGTFCQTLACDQPTDRDVTVMAVSRDHGQTFAKSVVDTNFDFPVNQDVGSETLTGENFRINSFPQLAYDPVTDVLAVAWNDDRNGIYTPSGVSVRTNGDNIVAFSVGGARWSAPTVLGTSQDEVFGAVAVRAGRIAVSSYTRHYDPNGVRLDYAYWTSQGVNALPTSTIQRISTESSDPRVQFVGVGLESGLRLQGEFIGDYTALAIGDDLRIHPCWTDFRGRPGVTAPNQDAYTQAISLAG